MAGKPEDLTGLREAARVLLFDENDRVLLLRGHDPLLPDRTWWFTVGGGLEGQETARQAAARELQEETGVLLDEAALTGPVWERTAVFDFLGGHYRQHELYFVAKVRQADIELSTDLWSDTERDAVDEMAWFSRAELAAVDIEVFPVSLASLISDLPDWDGTLLNLGIEEE